MNHAQYRDLFSCRLFEEEQDKQRVEKYRSLVTGKTAQNFLLYFP